MKLFKGGFVNTKTDGGGQTGEGTGGTCGC